jgi:energy-coupling factor transport system ATP-binding protein
LISFQSVSLVYRQAQTPAVDSVTLTVPDGQILSIVGANGSGKSTLGRLMNGLLLPSTGTVTVDGVSTLEPHGMHLSRRSVGMVFQNPDSGIVSASVEEDVAFVLENRSMSHAPMRQRVDAVLELVGLSGRRRTHPLDLTTSERALLGLAAAVAGEPRYLILDEATAYLDAHDRRSLLMAVDRVHEATGMAVILITHLMEEALLTGRVLVMQAGSIVFDGTPQALFEDAVRARSWRLELPFALQVAQELRDRGVEPGPDAQMPDTLADALCRL